MPRTSKVGREKVREVYESLRVGRQNVSAAEVFRKLTELHSYEVVRKQRTVEDDVRRFKKEERENEWSYQFRSWPKWSDSSPVHASAMPGVLLINSVSQELVKQPLSEEEALWAGRIIEGLAGLDPVAQWFLVWSYFVRDLAKRHAGFDTPRTFHLDQLLAFRPWLPENRVVWDLWTRSQSGMAGGFFPALEALKFQPLPDPLSGSLAVWATRQLIGPWDERDDEWAWEQILHSRYGDELNKKVNDAKA